MNVAEVAKGVHAVEGNDVNYLLLTDGDDVTLIDTGYPGDRKNLEAALGQIGRQPADVRAIVLTHAHTDHTGNARHIATVSAATVYAHAAEIPQLRGRVKHQVSPFDIAKQSWRPGVLPWALRAMRNGGLTHPTVDEPVALSQHGDALDVPGHPVPIPTPGHTPGSCCFYLRQHGVLASGDSLITAHPASRRRGPQLITDLFQYDADEAAQSLKALRTLPGDVIVPGHGPVYRGPIGAAVLDAAALV